MSGMKGRCIKYYGYAAMQPNYASIEDLHSCIITTNYTNYERRTY